ncbi:MAG: hypothetical protein ACF8NJ_10810 [Phycisphaerales bacterium JB038]
MHPPHTIQALALLAGGPLLASAPAALSQVNAGDFVYDTTAGLTCVYTGDLSTGVMVLQDIDGRPFRAQLFWDDGSDVANGIFGVGGASFYAGIDLVQFIDNTPVGSGAGDVAVFAGAGAGTDVVITDEFGNTMQASVVEYALTDRTSSMVRPGLEGIAVLDDVVFLDPEFQGLCTQHQQSTALLFTFTWVIEQAPGDPVTLEEYLASSGLGGLAVEVETLEMRVQGSQCWGDLDGDNDIDQADLGELLASYGQDDGGDLNCDGSTDQADLSILLTNYGIGCP